MLFAYAGMANKVAFHLGLQTSDVGGNQTLLVRLVRRSASRAVADSWTFYTSRRILSRNRKEELLTKLRFMTQTIRRAIPSSVKRFPRSKFIPSAERRMRKFALR